MRARIMVSRAIPLPEMNHHRNEHVCSTSWINAYQKTQWLWGEVQRIRRRIRKGFESIRICFGGFAATYEMICENRMRLVYFTHWA